ncbi:MAG: hypothetical protein K6T73_08665 [Candidatus Bathyarchaeota archaeon]|nr:hypothetical protein [Candidatus Bathyarchaeota archaeon]
MEFINDNYKDGNKNNNNKDEKKNNNKDEKKNNTNICDNNKDEKKNNTNINNNNKDEKKNNTNNTNNKNNNENDKDDKIPDLEKTVSEDGIITFKSNMNKESSRYKRIIMALRHYAEMEREYNKDDKATYFYFEFETKEDGELFDKLRPLFDAFSGGFCEETYDCQVFLDLSTYEPTRTVVYAYGTSSYRGNWLEDSVNKMIRYTKNDKKVKRLRLIALFDDTKKKIEEYLRKQKLKFTLKNHEVKYENKGMIRTARITSYLCDFK